MMFSYRTVAYTFALALALSAGLALAAALRAPYVPTPQIVVDTMLDLAQVGPQDFVIDLGSGDGRIVTTAAKRNGARGVGIELDANLVQFARQYAREQGVAGRVRFEQADLFNTDLRQASVVALYLLPEMLIELRPKFLTTLRPGTRIVAHDFDLGDWRPDEHLSIPVPGKPVGPAPQSDIYLWIVPAAVAGDWQGRLGNRALRIAIDQRFQEIGIDVFIEGRPVATRAARLRGSELAFELESEPQIAFSGIAAGGRVRGSAQAGGKTEPWFVEKTASAATSADRERKPKEISK